MKSKLDMSVIFMTISRRDFNTTALLLGIVGGGLGGFVTREMGKVYAEGNNKPEHIAADENVTLAEAEEIKDERVKSFSNRTGAVGLLAGAAGGLAFSIIGDAEHDNEM